MGFKMKDDVVFGIGVNGVFLVLGVYKGLYFSSIILIVFVYISLLMVGLVLL